MTILELARPEIRDLQPYDSPAPPAGYARLNANELAQSPYTGPALDHQNRYPQMRPSSLRDALADHLGVEDSLVAPVRGSSEGIDLLMRIFCRAYTDNIVAMPPTFEMYAAYAAMQGARVRNVALNKRQGFTVDWDAVRRRCDDNTKLVFVCSPNNPTGNSTHHDEILDFVNDRQNKSIVVVDEAYIEFSSNDSLVSHVTEHSNLVVLRTLSKAAALAGCRCGAVVASEDVITLVAAMSSPYAFSSPVTDVVLQALAPDNVAAARAEIAQVVARRDWVAEQLAECSAISRVWPSDANFLLVEVTDPNRVAEVLSDRQILVRQFPAGEDLSNCLRITVGSESEMKDLVAAMQSASA